MLFSCTSDNDDNPGKPRYDGVPLVILDTATGNDRYQKPGSKAWCDEMLEKIRKSLLQSRRE